MFLVQNKSLNVYVDWNGFESDSLRSFFFMYLFGILYAIGNALGTGDFKVSSLPSPSYYLTWR